MLSLNSPTTSVEANTLTIIHLIFNKKDKTQFSLIKWNIWIVMFSCSTIQIISFLSISKFLNNFINNQLWFSTMVSVWRICQQGWMLSLMIYTLWVSDCYLLASEQFLRYIMERTRVTFIWSDDDDVNFVLNQPLWI